MDSTRSIERGPTPPFLRLLDDGVIDSRHEVWLWPQPQSGPAHYARPDQPKAIKLDAIEDVYDLTQGPAGLYALRGGGEVVRVSRDHVTSFGSGYRSIVGNFRQICMTKTDGMATCREFEDRQDGSAEQVATLDLKGVVDIKLPCVLQQDGGVSCWSTPWSPGSAKSRTPTRVPGLANIVEIASGSGFRCARRNDGTVWCWGENTFGQLGIELGRFHAKPVRVKGIDDAIAIAASDDHACALRPDRQAWCWGSNDWLPPRPGGAEEGSGPRVRGPYVRCPTPQPLPGFHDISQLAPNAWCALEGDRKVMCWEQMAPTCFGSGSGYGAGMPREILWKLPTPIPDAGNEVEDRSFVGHGEGPESR